VKVLAIVASPKRGGNVSNICNRIIEGAKQSGHNTEIINLYDYNIKYCTGCLSCTKNHRCSIEDDFTILFDKEKEADIVIYGTPIYCHDVPGILKNFIDRHAHAVIPHVELENIKGFFAKSKIALNYVKEFNQNGPFRNKKFIVVIACSNPNKGEKQMKQVLFVLKSFIQGEMKATIVKKVIYTDTLFKFKKKGFDKIMKSAYQIGVTLR
jgi:multimeric flavodoxin WrbA